MLTTNQSNPKDFDPQLLRDICDHRNSEVINALQHGNLHRVADSSGKTLIHFAIEYGNYNIMRRLIRMGADVNAQDCYGTTPLMLTLKQGRNYGIEEILLKADANIYLPNSEGHSALQILLHHDSVGLDIICMFFRRVKRDYANIDDIVQILSAVDCPLYHAVHFKDTRVTRSRLEAGCSVDSTDSENARTALHIAVGLSDSANVEVLLLHGANVNTKDSSGRTPLSHFNANGDSDENLRILQLLLDRGPELYRCDAGGRMQIYYVLKHGSRSVVKILLQRGIRLNKKDKHRQTPLFYLAENKTEDISIYLQGKRFNANISDRTGWTPLLSAASVGNLKNVQFLLDNGAKTNTVNCRSPLRMALSSPFLTNSEMEMTKECIELLLQHGADVQYEWNGIHTVFDNIWWRDRNFPLSQPILLQLAIQEMRGIPITKAILDKIESNDYFKRHFNLYRKQLTEMQEAKVYGSVTLFKLAVESDRQILHYARNPNVVKRLKRISNKCTESSQCKEYLRKRVSKAIRTAQVKRQAAIAVDNIVNLGPGCYTNVVDRIVDYLNDHDVKNLLNVQGNVN